MVILLIQWMNRNYALRHQLLTGAKNLLGNHQAENYKDLVEKLLKSLLGIGANMSLKVDFLHNDVDRFPGNCGDASDEQGERFQQGIKTMEERYLGRMLPDNCRSINRNLNNIEYDRQSRKRKFLQ